jgi:hypothetical protein
LCAVVPACGSVTDTAEGEQVACENGECAVRGPQMLHEVLRRRPTRPKAVDAGAPGGAMPQDVAVFPCAICARADNCCKAETGASCGYRSACTSAHSTDEVSYYSALCRLLVESGPSPDGACGSAVTGVSP